MIKLPKVHRVCVKQTFVLISDRLEKFAEMFYERLFEVAPEVKPLFKEDTKVQGKKLIQTLAMVVSSLDHLSRITPQIRNLGQQHLKYGIKPEYYTLVGDTLLWTLEQNLGKVWTPEVKEAWTHTYSLLVELMTQEDTASEKRQVALGNKVD